MKRVEQLLNREIGLMAHSIGSPAIEAAVRGRMLGCQCATLDEYLLCLEQSSTERSLLVEEIVVSETWFFRDAAVFKDLERFSSAHWRRSGGRGLLRVLCVPCATGEEPYSAAIVLLEAGLPAGSFSVLGVDVSQRALERAKAAVYGKHSFREPEPAERSRYFESVSGGRKVTGLARDAVTVIQGNVLDASLVPASSKFDVIFCRNLLIYLDSAARARALDNLCLWLAPDGILFGGHAEAIDAMDPRFQHLNDAGHCAYVRRRAVVLPAQPSQPAASTRNALQHRATGPGLAFAHSTAVKAPRARVAPWQAKPVIEKPAPGRSTAAARALASLEEVTALANRGDPTAAAACERHIAEVGASPEAYCLLGVIRNAAGAEQAAIEAFNRALYLEQTHYASLIHLALVHERRGDLTVASNFRRRAEKVQQKQGAK